MPLPLPLFSSAAAATVSAPTITRADFLRALRREMPAALAEIRRAGVGPN